MKQEILEIIREKGLLLEKEIFDLVNSFGDVEIAKKFLDNFERLCGKKMITKSVLNKNFEFVQSFVKDLPGENKTSVENIFVKLGLSLEVRREEKVIDNVEDKPKKQDYQVFYADTKTDKKIEVKDFIGNFRARYQALQGILMNRMELQQNLMSINKISGDRQNVCIIGIVSEKRITKNKNMIIKFEDLTGEISAIVMANKEELFKKAGEVRLDDIVGIKASGNKDMLFVYDIFFPDAIIHEKVKFDEDINVIFLSDLHCGNKLHLKKNFEEFLKWLNGADEEAKKVKYIFFSGDNVDGIGVFPGQEDELNLKSMKEQYALVASYLRKIPKHITIFMCPGQHDATRVPEPQPIINKKYGFELYDIENLVLVTNPTMVKLLEGDKELKILMYHGAIIHDMISEIPELREIKAHSCPAKAFKHLLKRRHLAPVYSAIGYGGKIPTPDNDPMVIKEVPDILCTGEVHRLDVDNYNGILIITGSCWQAQTPFEEKVGNMTDPCKVPVLNLKTRALKIYDFSDEGGNEY